MRKILLGLIITLLLTLNISVSAGENINILVIDDNRCIDCKTKSIIDELKLIPSLSNANFINSEFSEDGISDYLKENNVNKLPAVIFKSNNIDNKLNLYLTELPDGEYSLQLGARFDPFEKRSDRGFKIIDNQKLKDIKNISYIKGDKNSQITLLEYSDIECPYCSKLHNSGTFEILESKYGNKLNIIFNHFPLGFHKNAQIGAEILECVGNENGINTFYQLINKAYTENKSNKDFLIDEAVKLGVNKEKLNKCLNEGRYTTKIENQMNVGSDVFNITGTPGNVLINNKTGEYKIISGAYPKEEFIKVIDSLLLPELKNYTKLHIISRSVLKRNKNQAKYVIKIDNIVYKLPDDKLKKIFNKLVKIDRNNRNLIKYKDFFNYFEARIALKLGK